MKAHARDLAVLGGAPAFPGLLHVGRPNLGNRDELHRRIDELWERRWLTNDGELVRELEQRLCDYTGARHCVATSNGTAALDILVRAAGLTGEVILPSFTFVGTAHALAWSGLEPVFCDVDPTTHTLDPGRVEELVSDRTSAILGVHLWGAAHFVDELRSVATRHSLALFFDAAHAFGARYKGQPVGRLGDAEVFSFHATKIVNSFEGGAITTDDDALAARLRLLRNFGFEDYDRVVDLGTNAKMSEASAAMGLTSLDALDHFLAANARNLVRYRHRLADVAGVRVVSPDPREGANGHYVVLEVDPGPGLTRDELQQALWKEGVLARRYFYPGCHAHEPYATRHADAARHLPVTEKLVSRVLCLPTGTAVTEGDIDEVCAILALAQASADVVRRQLGRR